MSPEAKRNRLQAIVGALYLADNGRGPKSGKANQDRLVQDHLSRHTYLRQEGGKAGREYTKQHNAKSFRQVMVDTVREWRTQQGFTFLAHNQNEPPVDYFFRLGSSASPQHMLEKYGYSKANVSFSDLPPFEPAPEDAEPEPARANVIPPHIGVTTFHVWRSIWIVISDILHARESESQDNYRYRDRQSRITALSTLARRYNLQGRTKDNVLYSYDGQKLLGSVKNAWQEYSTDKKLQDFLWQSATISDWDPGYIQRIVDATEQLTAAEGLPAYGADFPTAPISQASDQASTEGVPMRLHEMPQESAGRPSLHLRAKAESSANDLLQQASEGVKPETAQTSKNSPLVAGNLHVRRSIWIVICDMQKAQQSSAKIDYKYGEQHSRLEALSNLAAQYRLHGRTAEGSIHLCNSEQLLKTMRNAWQTYNVYGKSARPPWSSASTSDWDPEFIQQIEAAARILARKGGFPLYETNDRTESASPDSEPRSSINDSPFHPETPEAPSFEELSPAESPAILRDEYQDTRRQSPSLVERGRSSRPVRRPTFSRKRARSASTGDGEFVPPSFRSSVSDSEDDHEPQPLRPSASSHHIQSVSSTLSSLLAVEEPGDKEIREPAPKRLATSRRVQVENSTHLQIDRQNLEPSQERLAISSAVQLPISTHLQRRQNPEPFPKTFATSGPLQEATSSDMQRNGQNQEPSLKRPSKLQRVSEPTFTELERDHQALYSRRAREPTPTHLERDHQHLENAPARPSISQRVQEPTFTELVRDHEALYSELDREMTNLLNRVGSFVNMPDPMPPSPLEDLGVLYARCLGKEWDTTHQRLHDSNRLLLVRFAGSLVAAFIFDKVLDDSTLGHKAVAELLEAGLISPTVLSGGQNSARSSLASVAGVSKDGLKQPDRQTLTAFFSKQAYLQEQECKELEGDLSRTLEPYFTALAQMSVFHGPRPTQAMPEWRLKFRDSMLNIFRKALSIRAKLSRTSYSHDFIWPAHGDGYDVMRMKPAYDYNEASTLDNHQVTFTKWPALVVRFQEVGEDMVRELTLCRAEVVLMPRPLGISGSEHGRRA